MIACLRLGVPAAGVYLVLPSRIALWAASLMCSGVSKSGSPAPRERTSLPWALSSAALAVTARVGEGLMRPTRWASESSTIVPLLGVNKRDGMLLEVGAAGHRKAAL